MSTLTFYVRLEPTPSESDAIQQKAMQAIVRTITGMPEDQQVCGMTTTKAFREWSCGVSVDGIPHQWLIDANLLAGVSPIMYGYSWCGSIFSTAKGKQEPATNQTDLADAILERIARDRKQMQEMSFEDITSTLVMFMNGVEDMCRARTKDIQS